MTPQGLIAHRLPGADHEAIAEIVHQTLADVLANGQRLGLYRNLAIAVPSLGSIFVPNLSVVSGAQVSSADQPIGSERVVLAVEIASRTHDEDDHKRREWAGAHAGVPQYVLIGGFRESGPALSWFSNPRNGCYRNMHRTSFGKELTLAAPVAAIIDSALFPIAR